MRILSARLKSLRRRPARIALALGLLALLILLGLLAGGRLRARDRAWERIVAEGALRVGLDASFPPFESLNPETGAIAGLDVDLATQLGEELGGIRPQIMNIGFDGLYDSLLAGRFDVIISALPVDFTWTKDIHYSPAYFEAGLVLVTRGELTAQIREASDLAGHKVAIEWGSEGDAHGRQLARRLGRLTLKPYQTPADALAALLAGEADAALVDAISAYQFIRQHAGLDIVGPPLTQASYAIAVRQTSPILAKNVDRALRQLKTDGRLDALIQKWL
jgi:polar amino acid transport system substrate-binding protein